MSVTNLWAKHYQSVWEERAADQRLPYWLRVACLAYGKHTANGHAMFKPGQIGLVLATVDKKTGEVKPLDKGSVQRAIRTAADNSWLLPESRSRCLVVPGHAIQLDFGHRGAPCPQHPTSKVGTERPPKSLRVVS